MREHLPHRRPSETLQFTHEGAAFTASVSFYQDGRPAEIFMSGGKVGTGLDHSCRDAAVVASLALQHGVPVETLRHAITRLDDGTAAGPLGKVLDRL
jgi:hypothetical protein